MGSDFDQLIAEYYGLLGYFVRHNVILSYYEHKKQHLVEADVLGYKIASGEFLHVEGFWSASDIDLKETAIEKFRRFKNKYAKLFGIKRKDLDERNVRKIAIGGWNVKNVETHDWNKNRLGIEFIHKRKFFREIVNKVNEHSFTATVMEAFPRLRTIQSVIFYSGYFDNLEMD